MLFSASVFLFVDFPLFCSSYFLFKSVYSIVRSGLVVKSEVKLGIQMTVGESSYFFPDSSFIVVVVIVVVLFFLQFCVVTIIAHFSYYFT